MAVNGGNSATPRHVAIIMDGNGRWAKQRMLPRMAGHKAGVDSVRSVVRGCAEQGVEALTLFAFSTENWRRPEEEVGWLMNLFLIALKREVGKLHKNGIRLRVIGDRAAFSSEIRDHIERAEALTRDNRGLTLVIAASYGGRWELAQVAREMAAEVHAGQLEPAQITPEAIADRLSLHDLPEVDLFIRTGGEQRVSNFLLWELAYAELYFTDLLWPDFDQSALAEAFASFAGRQRRFGCTGEQIEAAR